MWCLELILGPKSCQLCMPALWNISPILTSVLHMLVYTSGLCSSTDVLLLFPPWLIGATFDGSQVPGSVLGNRPWWCLEYPTNTQGKWGLSLGVLFGDCYTWQYFLGETRSTLSRARVGYGEVCMRSGIMHARPHSIPLGNFPSSWGVPVSAEYNLLMSRKRGIHQLDNT